MTIYSTDHVLPAAFLNGYILLIYLQNQCSVTSTGRLKMEQLCPGSSGNFVYQIGRLVQSTIDTFKKLGDVKELKQFQTVCALQFSTSKLEK